MKKFKKKNMILIKKCIGLAGSVFCLFLMMFNFIKYTSSTTLISGSDITFYSNVSLTKFLFNGEYAVFDGNINILRDVFGYSHVLLWIVFILSIISIVTLVCGIFVKKSLISKIGSCVSLGSVLLLLTLAFDRYSYGNNTVRYLDIFTLIYGLMILFSVLGFISVITLEDK